MATLTTKFSIGDTVYYATTFVATKQHPCPDCLGSRQWKATSPAGDEFEFSCPRCTWSYQSNNDLNLKYAAHEASVVKLTIGQVRAYDGGDREETEYMCVETGVGSGSIYYESKLFETEQAARAAGEALAAINNSKIEWVVKRYNRSLDLSDYHFLAAAKKGEDDRENMRRIRMQILLEDMREAKDMEDVRMVLESFDRRQQEAA